MRASFIVLGVLLLAGAGPAAAQPKPAVKPPAKATAGGPKAIGTFDDWLAAIHSESGTKVCYAFTRAGSSIPRLPGRGDVVLTVTQRPNGRDAVAISAGFVYPPNAEVTMQVDQAGLPFYTAGRAAFARDGHAAVLEFQKGREAVARSPGPRDKAQVADTFSLRGFTAAYAAINKECAPP